MYKRQEVELSSQQVICPYCGGVIQSEFYDWQTEAFEIYEKMGANMQYGLLLLAYSGIMFLCLTLCLYLIKDTDISLTIGVITTLLILLGIAKIFQSKEEKQEKLPKEIVRYSENYLRSVAVLGYFDIMVCGPMVKNGKPAPDIYLKASELLNLDPSECLMVGNDVEEDLAIRALGVPVFLITDTMENKKNLPIDSECLSLIHI